MVNGVVEKIEGICAEKLRKFEKLVKDSVKTAMAQAPARSATRGILVELNSRCVAVPVLNCEHKGPSRRER